ncbi:hypothetical protein FO519_005248 [Halicephalobus sp. NKZ332]|nr:hypothetical protein FO519_005248 [Halicephalobus sp. NKZ332]
MNESRILRLGYVRENFPYVSACALRGSELRRCRNPGIMSDLWLQFADFYGYQIELVHDIFYGGFNETTNHYYGLLNLLVTNKIDATLSLFTPNEQRIKAVSLGPVMTTYQTGFVYGQPILDQTITIRVFDCSLTSQPFSTEKEFEERLRQKALQVVIEDETMFPAVQDVYPSKTLYNQFPPILIDDYSKIVDKICSNKKFVYFGNIAQMGGIWFAKPPCPIKILSYSHNNSIQTTLVIGYRKNLPSKLKKQIHDFMSNLVTIDTFDTHWAKMYRSYYGNDAQVLAFSAIKIESMVHVVYVYTVMIGVSCGLLVLEWIVFYSAIIWRKHPKIINFNFLQESRIFKIFQRFYPKNNPFVNDNWILKKDFLEDPKLK